MRGGIEPLASSNLEPLPSSSPAGRAAGGPAGEPPALHDVMLLQVFLAAMNIRGARKNEPAE